MVANIALTKTQICGANHSGEAEFRVDWVIKNTKGTVM